MKNRPYKDDNIFDLSQQIDDDLTINKMIGRRMKMLRKNII